jgi:peptidoglycan/LPS O-acetylase OafA/YrhL
MSPPDFAPRTIPSPGSLSNVPDPATQKGLDLTGAEASGRVLHLNLGFFKYGTSDKSHAAAVSLSLLLVVVLLAISVCGMFSPNAGSFDKAIGLVGNAMMLVIGVAIGQKTSASKKEE